MDQDDAERFGDTVAVGAQLKLLDWLTADPTSRPAPGTLAGLLRLGVRDLQRAGEIVARSHAANQVELLLEACGGQQYPGDVDAAIPLLNIVGWQVLTGEPENADDWAAAVTPLLAYLAATPLNASWQFARAADGSFTDWRRATGAQIVAGFLAAGRGPAYAHDLIARAISAGVAPDTFGYGPAIRPETFTALTDAGLSRPQHLAAYQAAGLGIEQTLAMASDGVCAGAAVALQRDGIPVERWVETAGGLPEAWFPVASTYYDRDPDPVAKGLRGRGFSWPDLRFLADHGWSTLRPEQVDGGMFISRGRSTGPLTATVAVAAAAVIPLSKVETWCAALTDGKRGRLERNDPALPPLVPAPYGSLLADSLPAIATLSSLCVAPSSLGLFRKAGCRSVDDIATAVRAGINAARAKELIDRLGPAKYRSAPRRISDLGTLLALHRKQIAEATA